MEIARSYVTISLISIHFLSSNNYYLVKYRLLSWLFIFCLHHTGNKFSFLFYVSIQACKYPAILFFYYSPSLNWEAHIWVATGLIPFHFRLQRLKLYFLFSRFHHRNSQARPLSPEMLSLKNSRSKQTPIRDLCVFQIRPNLNSMWSQIIFYVIHRNFNSFSRWNTHIFRIEYGSIRCNNIQISKTNPGFKNIQKICMCMFAYIPI